MTEPENFEDDLFADLYNDDEPAAKAPAATEPFVLAPPAPDTVKSADESNDHQDQNGVDSYMNHDEAEEDDDDVDFNLGNNGNGTMNHNQHNDASSSYSAPPPAAAPAKGPNAKEDG